MNNSLGERDRAIAAVGFLAERGGRPLSDQDRRLLGSTLRSPLIWSGGVYATASGDWKYSEVANCPDMAASDLEGLGNILTGCFHGFWISAANGTALTEEAELVEWQGAPVLQAYPGAGAPFLRFATTYWTMNTVWRSLLSSDQVVTKLLGRLCTYIGDIFFPALPPRDRAKWTNDQQQIIASFCRGLDPVGFVESNPLLAETKRSWWPFRT